MVSTLNACWDVLCILYNLLCCPVSVLVVVVCFVALHLLAGDQWWPFCVAPFLITDIIVLSDLIFWLNN